MTVFLNNKIIAETLLIPVSSNKGGVGKSSTSLNLAIALCERGLNVILLEADPQAKLNNLIGDVPTYTSRDVIGKKVPLSKALMTIYKSRDDQHKVSFLAGYTEPVLNIDSTNISELQNRVKKTRDYIVEILKIRDADIVILDLGAGNTIEHQLLLSSAKLILIVITNTDSSVEDATRQLKDYYGNLKQNPAPVGLFVNQLVVFDKKDRDTLEALSQQAKKSPQLALSGMNKIYRVYAEQALRIFNEKLQNGTNGQAAAATLFGYSPEDPLVKTAEHYKTFVSDEKIDPVYHSFLLNREHDHTYPPFFGFATGLEMMAYRIIHNQDLQLPSLPERIRNIKDVLGRFKSLRGGN